MNEIVDGLGIGEVTLECGRREQEVVPHEPGDSLRFGRVKAETRTEFQRDLRTNHAVIAAAALGDIVQQHRRVEDSARRDLLLHDRG